MPPRLKKAPPYDDDPGCKYIVIENPWPGGLSGKNRDQAYFNRLCAWVRFFLNKEAEVECLYTVNTVCTQVEHSAYQVNTDMSIRPLNSY